MNIYINSALKRSFLNYFILSMFTSILPLTSHAASYYASPSGSGSSCSTDSRCTLATALGKLAGGDTLILGDGTYSTAIKDPRSGSVGAYTIIKAENDGGAIIETSSSGAHPLVLGTDYVKIEGLKFSSNVLGSSSYTAYISGSYNKILRTAFVMTPTLTWSAGNDQGNLIIVGTHNLFEDCWVWGGGRYKIIVYGGDGDSTNLNSGSYNILRRCVVRHDRENSHLNSAGTSSNPQAGIANYMAGNNLYQNCIVLDTNQEKYYQTVAYKGPMFFEKGQDGGNVYIRDCILLHNAGGMYDSYSMGIAGNFYISNLINWDNGEGFQTYYNPSGRIYDIDHATFGSPNSTGGNDFPGWALYTGNSVSNGAVAKNSVFYNWNISGKGAIANVGGADDYNSFYGNTTNRLNSTTGAHDLTTVNPIINSLKYLPRIETGGSLKGAGSGGSDIGATVMYKRGVSGTLWGEIGYDAVTSDPLWPWPNEARIKADMSTYPSNWPADNLPSPVRGFTFGNGLDGSPQTLTKYIWEYLGNQIPANIYGVTSSLLPPQNPKATKL